MARAQDRGRWAELLAKVVLRLKGYQIIPAPQSAPRRYGQAGQVDIIAKRGNVLAFVEVKSRQSIELAQYAITPQQQNRYIAAARGFVAANPRYQGCDIRFDAIFVTPKRWPQHLTDAWRA